MDQRFLDSFLRSGAAASLLALSGAVLGCASDVEPPPVTTTTTTSTTSAGGAGGAGGEGGAGGAGGGVSNLCGEDCSQYPTMPCYKSVCNEGQYLGPIGFCVVTYDDGATCDDGLFCTVNDVCLEGVCGGPDTNDCGMDAPSCQAVECNEASDTCSVVSDPALNDTPCVSDDLCQVLSKCTNGACVGQPKDCTFSPLNECNTTACNPATGACDPTVDPTKDGAACSLTGDPCMVGKTCDNGQCMGGAPKDCSAFTSGCNNGICNAQTGNCMADPIPPGGTCLEAADACNTGVCDAMGVCQPVPLADGTACNDYNSCTDMDACTAGTCGGSPVSGCSFFFEESFEGGCPPGGWTLGGDWECGTPSGVGPTTGWGGTYCIATQIDANYNNNQAYTTAYAQTPMFSLPAGGSPVMQFRAWISTEGSVYDGMNIKISTDGGATWSIVSAVTPAYNLTSAGGEVAWGGNNFTGGNWQQFSVNLAAYAGNNALVRFSFRTDGSVVYPGVYVDDIVVSEAAAIPLQITTTTLPNALTNVAYSAALAKTGGTASSVWSIVGETNGAWLTINPSTGALTGTPAAGNIGPFTVTVHVEEPSLPSNFDEVVLTGEVIQAVWGESFEGACPNGWTLGGDWECGVPSVVGPATAYAGTQCIGTQIDANYSANQAWATTIATSPAISLAGTVNPQLTFRMWNYTEGSIYDAANLKISTDGTTFTQVMSVTPAYNVTVSGEQGWGTNQSSLGWQLVTVDLTPYAGQTIYLRYAFRSDSIVQYPGFYVDDILIAD